MEKKSCRCRCPLFSCFACFSDENTTPSTAVPNAPNEALTHPYHDSQTPVAPPAASSSEATTSTDVRSASLSSSSSQPIVPSAAPLSSSHSQPNTSPSSSNAASSSSGSKADLDGHIHNIRTCANTLHTQNVEADLDGLIESVSQFLEVIKEEKSTGNESSKTKLPAKNFWQSPSESLKKFKEVLSEGINVFKDIIPGEAKTAVQGLLKGMGTAHLATTGLLIVALVLERLETVSANRKECLCVLDEICTLAQHVKKLQQRPQLKEGMEDSMKKAMGLIVEAAMMCSAQIGSPKGWRFLTASENKDLLVNFQQKLQKMYRHMDNEMGVCIYDAANCRKVRPKMPQERPYPHYAVGIEEALKQVTELLEWESENNAVAVILHGFGGMGKTTLADAVFARLYIEGCKYSMVKLFDDINSTPSTSDILKLQKYILEDLKMETLGEDLRTVEEGQREIGSILQREKAFIYVDNVLLRYPLEQLLPRDMVNAKKLRLLITTRDIDACSECTKMIPRFYDMKGLPLEAAKSLLKTEMKSQTDGMEEQLNSSQLDRIAEICGGIPKLLEVVARFIRVQKDKQKAYDKVIEEKEKNWKGKIGKDIASYVFAYQYLDEMLKDPFLDICAFFNGWDWDTVANIVGDDELEMLEQRALVKKDPRLTVRVHDVILAMGRQQTQGTRFTITNQSQIQNLEDEDAEKIKGIRLLSGNKVPMIISASIIDSMCSSLRVLELGDSIKVEGMCEKSFKKLIYFVDTGFHLRFNVSKSKELKYFYAAAKDFNLFQDLQMPSSLVHVELNGKSFNSHPSQISSQCLGQLRNLRVLTLTSFSQLTQLPQKLVDVAEGLQYLRLESCEHLEELPEFDSKLRCLKELEISSCKSFRKLPEDVGSLNSLQKLTLGHCESLEVLPSSLDKLSSLQELDVNWCKRLEVLPNGLDKLLSLKLLDLSWCQNLKNLTFDLGKLTSLVKLRLLGCQKLSSIPQSISQLKLLDSTMDLSFTGLKELPDGFCNLSFLTNLKLGWCRSLEKLPDRFGEVASLVKLSLNSCRSLKELPESFGRLKALEYLDLSRCSTLEELCRDFKGLLSLRVLSLDFCGMLKTLPEDFHCLASLEILYLRGCRMLEGKWMESVVKMKTLHMIVNIEGSPMLEERCAEIQRQGDQSVHTGQENVLKRLQAEFDSILTNGRGEAFHTSDIPLNTLLLVMFDAQEEFHDYYPLNLIEENIDDIESNVNMIYFGNHFNKLPKKVADRILGHAPANSNVQPLFQKVFATVGIEEDGFGTEEHVDFQSHFEMSMKIASDQKGDKYFSSWKLLGNWWYKKSVEKFVMKKCGRYQRLKKLAEGSAESNTELLRELFATGEGEDIHCCFVKNDGSDKVGVDELKGKTILLDIRPVNLGYELPLQALTEMYVAEKERLNFEIITIPVKRRYEKWDALDKFSSDIPWLVLESPWQLTNVTKYFLVEGCARWPQEWDESDDEWDEWYPNIMRVIDSKGRIAAHNSVGVLRMVNTWGAEAYPFTEEKSKELKEKEMNQMKTMSDLMFIFKHLEEVEATHQPKMICLCTSEDIEFISSIRNALIEWSDSFVIIYIPKFGKKDGQDISFTDGIDGYYQILKRLEMVQIEMEGMTLLNLSEYKAMRFWARIFSLKEVMERIEDNQKQFSRMKNLLSSIDSKRLRNSGYSWMVIMDEDGNLLTTKGTEIVKVLSKENPDDKAKQLMQQLFKGAKESRKETLVELEQLLS